MNNLQVAKVVHEATRALEETTGSAVGAIPPEKWEHLSDHQRTQKTHEIATHLSRYQKGVDVDEVAQPLSEADKLKYYVSAAIAEAFSRYEAALEQTATDAQRQRTQPQYVADPSETERLEAKPKSEAEKLKRAQKTEPSSVDEALAKADAGLAKTNAAR